MKDIFQTLGEILKPELIVKRYMVKTETRGILYFDDLPQGTYFAMGDCGNEPQSKPGQAFYFTNDNGTCLIPIIDTNTGLQVIRPDKSGQSNTKQHETNNNKIRNRGNQPRSK